MPNWNKILEEINQSHSISQQEAQQVHDIVRRKYLKKLQKQTGRNIIIYYSVWLQKQALRKQGFFGFELTDADKNGFMACVHELDRSKGLDLILHTPGGEMAATESLVDYLRAMFGTNIRAIVH